MVCALRAITVQGVRTHLDLQSINAEQATTVKRSELYTVYTIFILSHLTPLMVNNYCREASVIEHAPGEATSPVKASRSVKSVLRVSSALRKVSSVL